MWRNRVTKADRNWREMTHERRSYTSFTPEGTLKLVHKLEFYWVEESKEGDRSDTVTDRMKHLKNCV